MNPLKQLLAFGQSFWYDNMRRKLLHDGTIAQLISDDGLRGITSNPAIFQKAIGESDDYDAEIGPLAKQSAEINTIYEMLAIGDIQMACDLFTDLYHSSNRLDGYVSLEVSPYLAQDTEGTIVEARRLHKAVARPNLMIKVPATSAGIPAIEQLISEGINVNVTLMFNMAHYNAVAHAYIDGLSRFSAEGGDPAQVASVASFFVSRVDGAVDKMVNERGRADLAGKTAIANCQLVYQKYKQLFHGTPFRALSAQGAMPQRLLWASTSTKNRAYPDTIYVDQLIGPETVNTMPPNTVDAFRDHGTLANRLEQNVDSAYRLFDEIARLGINLDAITEQLQVEGVNAFSHSFDTLSATIANKLAAKS